jgi:hypothetical protein
MTKISDALTYGLTIRESATDGSDFTNPSADYRRLFLGEDGQLHVKDSAGAVTDIGVAGSGSSLLAVKAYASGSDAVVGATTTSLTLVDADDTNAAVTFTAPASGNVLVRLSGLQSGASASYLAYWGLREATSIIGTQVNIGRQSLNGIGAVAVIYLTGISAGSHTYKWAIASGNSGQAVGIYAGPTHGQIVMEVWAAP